MSDKIREALAGMLAIVDESRGVEGYRLNGDIAEWDEFPEVEAARTALAQQPAPVAVPEVLRVQVCKLGRYGAAYDPASTHYAYSYFDQPDNVGAMKLGRAAATNSIKSHGDEIDRGLHLLKTLQEEGFGVFQIAAAPAAPVAPREPVAKIAMPTEAELIAIAERLNAVGELCVPEDHPDMIWRVRIEVRELVREVLKTYAAPPAAEQPAGTTSDQYRAELYDEVWEKARDMGYGNVTEALVALERMKAGGDA